MTSNGSSESALRARCQRQPQCLAIGHAVGVVAVVVEDIPDHAQTGPFGDFEHVFEGEDAVVVFDHEPGAGALGEPLEGAQEAELARLVPSLPAADVEDNYGVWTEPHRVEQARLQLHVSRRRFAHLLGSRVQDDVLTGMAREAHAQLVGVGAELRELCGAVLDLSVEFRQIGMGAVRDECGRQAIHADLDAREVLEDAAQPLE